MKPENAASLIFLHDSWDVAEKFQKNRASKKMKLLTWDSKFNC
jgi:hypothetical protein